MRAWGRFAINRGLLEEKQVAAGEGKFWRDRPRDRPAFLRPAFPLPSTIPIYDSIIGVGMVMVTVIVEVSESPFPDSASMDLGFSSTFDPPGIG